MSGGVAAGLGEVIEDLPEPEEFVQGALFGDDLEPEEVGALDAPSPLSKFVQPRKPKGPGRPKGSKNRRTEAVVGWLLSQGRHPVLVMMETYGLTPVEMAQRLGLRHATKSKTRTLADGTKETVEVDAGHFSNDLLVDLLKLQLRMAEAVAPYVAQKLPQAVQIDTKAGVTIAFEGVLLPARAGEAGNPAAIEGEWQALLPAKSETESRTDAQAPE